MGAPPPRSRPPAAATAAPAADREATTDSDIPDRQRT